MNKAEQQSQPLEETKRGGQSVGGMGLVIVFCLTAHFIKANPDKVEAAKTWVSDVATGIADTIRDANKGMDCETLALARAPTLGCTNK